MVIEFDEKDTLVFDEIMIIPNRHPSFEGLRLNDESVLSLPGLEIYPNRRKVFRDRREINLTTKEYCILSANVIATT